ncbi:hypothetical protein MDAP_000730 [Mitosporidium daphniae]|uniref:Uncharacterized protein n=1 Tax=Mitosporidium daphniae TaxID=1485682 RepID=A0A098VS71_9MICR|nr:uncharacterized protein DI09_2p510 [Mitosporidium daphniae]KGG51674.1 hypothetical protein DI09_2p510 [Mitosporidium daphniae]|eukprot:XP_013238101.1 uncharacterized protein DI09_2p510 [Mitosporidium daphniae]
MSRQCLSSKTKLSIAPQEIPVIVRPKFRLEEQIIQIEASPGTTETKGLPRIASPQREPEILEKISATKEEALFGRRMVYKGVNALKRLRKALSQSTQQEEQTSNPVLPAEPPKNQNELKKRDLPKQPILLSNEKMEEYLKRLLFQVYGENLDLDRWRSVSLSDLKHKFFIVATVMQDLNREIYNTDLLYLDSMDDLFSYLQIPRQTISIEKGNPIKEVFVNYSPDSIPQNLDTAQYKNSVTLKEERARFLNENYQLHLSYLASKKKNDATNESRGNIS